MTIFCGFLNPLTYTIKLVCYVAARKVLPCSMYFIQIQVYVKNDLPTVMAKNDKTAAAVILLLSVFNLFWP